MSLQDSRNPSATRFRRFIAWYTVLLGAFSTLLLATIVLLAYVFDGNLAVYVDTFGEAGFELALFAVVVGSLPFGLFVIDEYLSREE